MEHRPVRRKRQGKRQAQRQKLGLRLGVAAGIFVLVIAGIIFAPRLFKTPSSGSGEDLGKTVVHLVAAGNLNITDNVASADYAAAFLDVAHLFAHADLSVVNLEGGFYGEPYGGETASAPVSLATALAAVGVDFVQLANSYAFYDGTQGMASTISGIQQAGMSPLGAYATQQEAKAGKGYTIREVQGVKIAMVAFTKGLTESATLLKSTEGCINLLYLDYDETFKKIDTEGITRVLKAVEKEKPDITIAFLHWGSEKTDGLSASQEKIRTLMTENGVDAIIGTHPHYVHKMELDPTTGTFIAYSLGDFFGDATTAGSEYSAVLDLEITKDNNTGKTVISQYSYTPVFTVTEKTSPQRVVRIREAVAAYEAGYLDRVSQETYERMKYALGRIEARVKGE